MGCATELRFIRATHDELRALLANEPVRAGMRCGALTFPTYRLVPDARWHARALPRPPCARAPRTRARARSAVYIAAERRSSRAATGAPTASSRATNALPAAAPTLRSGPFVVFFGRVRC